MKWASAQSISPWRHESLGSLPTKVGGGLGHSRPN
jgi:hypothetical protein